MKAIQNKLPVNANKGLVHITSRGYLKTFRPTLYNLRLYYSNLRRNDHGYGKWDMVYGSEGFEKVR